MHWLKQRFELLREGSGHNVRPMEGLRGFAVFLVFIVHYVSLAQPWIETDGGLRWFADGMHTIGNAGVDLFFVLSGYLIYASLIARPQPFLRFMDRRVQRIYPTFVLVLLVYTALSLALPSGSKMPKAPAQAVVYWLENFLLLPGLFPIDPLITVAWSLSYEMFYYLVLPLLIFVFQLRSRSSAWRVAFFATIAIAIGAYCAFFTGPVRLTMFIAGIFLQEAVRSGQRMPHITSRMALLALLAGLLNTLLPTIGSAGYVYKIAVLFASFSTLCWLCFVAPQAKLPRAFSWTPLRWLGNMSYSYYLIHGLVLQVCFFFLAPRLPHSTYGPLLFWSMLAPLFMLTLLGAGILFLLVERPFSLSPKPTLGTLPVPAQP